MCDFELIFYLFSGPPLVCTDVVEETTSLHCSSAGCSGAAANPSESAASDARFRGGNVEGSTPGVARRAPERLCLSLQASHLPKGTFPNTSTSRFADYSLFVSQ